MKRSLLVLIAFCCAQASGQSWDPAVLEKANTAQDTRYLKEDEKQVIYYTNLVRTDGQLFSETYLQWYLDSTQADINNYIRSLRKVDRLE